MKKTLATFCVLLLLASCDKCNKAQQNTTEPQKTIVVNAPAFISDTAYHYIQAQLDFGPRHMNSKGHEAVRCVFDTTKQSALPTPSMCSALMQKVMMALHSKARIL
jgi:hypothetical protein